MKTILFPTDFTRSGATALNWAKLFARQYAATVVLFHVQQMPLPDAALPEMGGIGVGMVNPDFVTTIEPIDQAQLDQLAAELAADGIACQTTLRWGSVADAIIQAASDLNVDLITMGRSHLDNFFEQLLGTEAIGVARKAHCPVLVVPQGEQETAALHTILFSTSLEFDQPTEFGQVVALARDFGATLSVLHVHAENQPSMADVPTMIAQLQQQYGETPLSVSTIEARTVTGGIETYLENHATDLLVMASRERGFLSGLLNPSLTARMVRITDKPILVYHTHGDL